MKDGFIKFLVFAAFVAINVASAYLKKKRKEAQNAPGRVSDAGDEAWRPDPDAVREFAEAQQRAGRPLDPEMAAALEAVRPSKPGPAVPEGPSEAELAMLEEQRRIAELAAELERRRQDAMAAFAPVPAERSEETDASPAPAGSVLDVLHCDPRRAVVLAEILAPPAGLRPHRS